MASLSGDPAGCVQVLADHDLAKDLQASKLSEQDRAEALELRTLCKRTSQGSEDASRQKQALLAELAAEGDAHSRGHMWAACLGNCLLVLLSAVDLVDQRQRVVAKVGVLHRLRVDAIQRYERHAPGPLGREQRGDARRNVIVVHHHMEELIAGRHLHRACFTCQYLR